MWKHQAVAIAGQYHRQQRREGQDRVYHLTQQGVTAIALSDGAGSAMYSHRGAEVAVKCICQILCREFDRLYHAEKPIEVRWYLLEQVRTEVKRIQEQQAIRWEQLACTLLAVAVKGDQYLLFHLGDGVIACQVNGVLKVASTPYNGEFTNTTVFVTSPDAILYTKVMKGTQPNMELFCLMSDGCEQVLYQRQKKKVAPLVRRMGQQVQLYGEQKGRVMLLQWLHHVIGQKSTDDCSLAFLTRMGRNFGNWKRMTQQERAKLLGIRTHKKTRRRHQIRKWAKIYRIES